MATYNWYRCFFKDELQEESALSAPARGVFGGIKKLMFCINGPVKNDPAWIARRLSFRDKRTVVKAIEEILDLGLLVVTDAGLVHVELMREIENHSAARAENGMKGGRGNKAAPEPDQEQIEDSFVSDDELMPISYETGGSQPIEKQQNTKKLIKDQNQTQNKNPPPTPSASASGQNGGGGGSDIEQIIAGFDQLLVGHFGEDERRSRTASSDRTTAGKWLDLAQGSVEVVISSIDAVMERERASGGDVPGSLGYYCNSVPTEIKKYHRPATLVAGTSSRNGKQQAATDQGDQTWLKAMNLAWDNGHSEEYEKLKHLAVTDPKQANEIGRSIMEIVSRKKERAAA